MIFKYIDYAFKARKGIKNTEELVSDLSFGPLEGFFIISFIILGITTLGLGFLFFHYGSGLALFFGILFLIILLIDLWIFRKVKKFFERLGKKTVDFSKQKYRKFNSEKIIDVDYE